MIYLHQRGVVTVTPDKRRKTEKEIEAFKASVSKVKGKKRNYLLNRESVNKIADAASKLWTMKNANEFVHFPVLTFSIWVDGKTANDVFKQFAKDLRRFHNCRAYIAVRELTKNGVIHYHLILLMPFQSYKDINLTLNKTFKKYGILESKNAFRTKKGGNLVKTIRHCVNYVVKYATKSNDSDNSRLLDFAGRNYFISNTCIAKKIALTKFDLAVIDDNFERFSVKKFEYCTEIKYENMDCDTAELIDTIRGVKKKIKKNSWCMDFDDYY